MKLVKQSNFTGFKKGKQEDYAQSVDNDLINLFNVFKGRIRLGTGTDGARGENLEGEFQVFACGAAGTTSVVSHTIGSVPIGFLQINQNGFGGVYMTSANTTQAIFATLGTSGTNYTVFLLK